MLEYPGQTWGHVDLKQVGFLRETRCGRRSTTRRRGTRSSRRRSGGRAYRAFADQSPGSWVYNDEMRPRSYNLERAAGLLDGAGLKPNRHGVRERGGELFGIELWGEAGDPQAPLILEMIAASWRQIGMHRHRPLATRTLLWGPMGYQFSDRMTAGYYRWSNVNDPDNMFYWHSSQIPTSPGGGGGNIPAFFNSTASRTRSTTSPRARPPRRTRTSAETSTTRSRNCSRKRRR